jgi:hypothetical protein
MSSEIFETEDQIFKIEHITLPDGACLYHSFARGIMKETEDKKLKKTYAAGLRSIAVETMKSNLSLYGDLLDIETDEPHQQYLDHLSKYTTFGGIASINCLGEIFGCQVNVYGQNGTLWYTFEPEKIEKVLNFILREQHYDFIVGIEKREDRGAEKIDESEIDKTEPRNEKPEEPKIVKAEQPESKLE